MPRFVREDETKEVHAPWWAEKETATIRRFNYGDRRWLAAQTVKFQIVGDQPIHEAQIERMNIAMIERGLVRWTDEEGKNLPKTPKQIGLLEPRDAEFILTEIKYIHQLL